MMFPAFCWHDLPGLIKACDYHINALPTPPVDGFRLPAPLHLVICAHFSTEERAWTPGSTCPAGLCFLLLENPESTARNRPKTFPPICHGQGSGPCLGLLSSRWETQVPPPCGSPGVTEAPLRLLDNIACPARIQPHGNIFLSFTFLFLGRILSTPPLSECSLLSKPKVH